MTRQAVIKVGVALGTFVVLVLLAGCDKDSSGEYIPIEPVEEEAVVVEPPVQEPGPAVPDPVTDPQPTPEPEPPVVEPVVEPVVTPIVDEPTPVVEEPEWIDQPTADPIDVPAEPVLIAATPLGFVTVIADWVAPISGPARPVWRVTWRVEWDAVSEATGYTVHVDGQTVYTATNEEALAYEYVTTSARQIPQALTDVQVIERDQRLTTLTTWGLGPEAVSWTVL